MVLKKSSFQYGMNFSIENEIFIPGPSLAAEKQGLGLKFSIENEIFKQRMKISSENEHFVRGGMFFFMRSSENNFFRSPGPLGTTSLIPGWAPKIQRNTTKNYENGQKWPLSGHFSVFFLRPTRNGGFCLSGKEKAHKYKQIFPVTAWVGGVSRVGGVLPTDGQGTKSADRKRGHVKKRQKSSKSVKNMF